MRRLGRIELDITEQKQTDEMLAERSRFIESIINLTTDILYIYDLDELKNIYCNNGLQKTLGYTVEEFQAMGGQILSELQ